MSVARPGTPARAAGGTRLWWAPALLEVTLAVVVVTLDLLLPALVLLALMVASLLLRHQRPAQVGLRRPDRARRMILQVLALSLVWTVLVFTVVTPLVQEIAGGHRDVTQFAALEGNLPLLAIMLLVSWTLAAFGEELAFRGYLLTRSAELLSRVGPAGPPLAVLLSSIMFGLVHTEQGVTGVVLTTLDGLMFSALRYHYATVWASVVAHGTLNTIGMTAYFLAGPVTAPW